jgi:Family of unknown function (DUF6113)
VGVLRQLAAFVAGSAVGLLALDVHRAIFPWGLLVAIAATYAVPWWLTGSSRPATAATYSVGWLVVFGVAIAGRPEGDFVVAADLEGYALMGVALILVLVAVVALARSRGPKP